MTSTSKNIEKRNHLPRRGEQMTRFTPLRFPDVDNGKYVPVGILIRRVRDLRRINQRQAAERIGVNETTLSAIETGRRPVKSVPMSMRIADGLLIPRLQLIEWMMREAEHFHPELRR
jgi:DNA-binding XRE family transcriptional regulator